MIQSSLAAAPAAPHFRDLFKPLERLRYMIWKLTNSKSPFRGTMRDGLRIQIRPLPNNDFGAAYEILQLQVYRPPFDPATVRQVIDLGGNVGFSCLYWAQNYPNARITVFEPHPVHCRIIAAQLRENGFEKRVTLKEAAAGAAVGEVTFADADDASCIVDEAAYPPHLMRNSKPAFPLIRVPKLDLFEIAGDNPVDILKMDIEGSEYEIMTDPRFDALAARTRCVMMEWHEQMPDHLGADWCADRLAKLGFRTEIERREGVADAGLIRAVRG